MLGDFFQDGRFRAPREPVHRWAISTDIDATESTLTDKTIAGANVTPLRTAERVTVNSGSTADASGGTGLRTLRLVGLDQNYLIKKVTLTMNGTTDVDTDTADTFLAINEMLGLTYGTGLQNAGVINAHGKTSSNGMGAIRVGANSQCHAHYMVPAGKELVITHWGAGFVPNAAASTQRGEFFLKVYRGVNTFAETIDQSLCGVDSGFAPPRPCFHVIAEKSFVIVTAIANANNVFGYGGFTGFLQDAVQV